MYLSANGNLSRQPRIFYLLITLITLVQGYFATQLNYDYNIEQLFPKHDPELAFYEEVKEKFAHHQDYLILGLENTESIYQGDFLLRLDSLADVLERHSLVKEVNAPTNLRYHFRTPLGIQSSPFLHPHNPERYAADSAFLQAYPDVFPKFIGRENDAVCVYVFLTEALTDQNKEEFRDFVVKQTMRLGFEHTHLYADIYAQDAYLKALEAEMYWLSGLAILLILGILFVSFRSLAGILVPIFIVALTVVWTMGTIALLGGTINMMTVLIPTIVAIISLSDVIHVINRFNDHGDLPKEEAIRFTFREMRSAILLTSLTTGLGFATLAYSSLQPFIEFGIFTTIGVAYAYLLAIYLLPPLLQQVSASALSWKGQRSDRQIAAIYHFLTQRPRLIIGVTAGLVLISLAGMSKLRINAYLYEELSAKDDFSKTLQFFETHFSGIRTFSMHLEVADSSRSIMDQEILQQIDQLENYLLEDYGLRDVYTIATQVKRFNRLHHQGQPAAFVLPPDPDFLQYLTDKVLENRAALSLHAVLTDDEKATQITGKMEDLGSAVIGQRNQQLTTFIDSALVPDVLKIHLTGNTLLLDKSNQIITYKLLYSLIFAIVVVSLLMGWLYRSWRISLLAILPNILPLLFMLGLIGWTEMGLKMSTVIVFTIAFGIAVDDTIHFMSRLKNELKAGISPAEAIANTYRSTGKAIVITSIILVLGFSVLLLSSFQTTFTTGLLVSLALLFALFADLLLLPVLLMWYYSATDASSKAAS